MTICYESLEDKMNLTKDKFEKLLKNSESLESDERFDVIEKLFNNILGSKVTFENEKVKIDGSLALYTHENKKKNPTIKFFGPSKDDMTLDRAFAGVKQMADKFEDHKDLAHKIGSLLGGFDFDNNHKMMDKYRIISNTITGKDDYSGTLTSQGQSRHPSSHFADNNYFFNIMHFIQMCKEEKTEAEKKAFENATMVLRYPSNHGDGEHKSYFYCKDDDDNNSKEYYKQNKVLEHRFPPKFLWMWANKGTVIHPLSLMAFRNFLDTEYVKKILKDFKDKDYTPIKITNMKFDDFTAVWKEISEKIMKDLGSSDINKVSKLISTIMIEETDIKNISELLKIGNKAVILWGPPGTGKTYESMEVVKEILELKDGEKDEDIEQNYLFSKKGEPDNEKGYYEIIQFHPNYTYEDFIGGISPKIDGSKVSYELREGIFYKFCKAASDKPKQKYIFIIDEINRAELSAVFGELLFALEYRGKSINLPHFGSFTIPENVYIIGTMNNVDKSLVTFDLALRRRFGFFKLMPKLDVLLDVLGDIVEEESLKRYVEKCKKLNEDIVNELSLGEDYQIGQAYFLKIKDFLKENKEDKKVKITSFDLERLWVYNIEPLLEEYLGMSMDDDEIKNELTKLKESFETDDIKS